MSHVLSLALALVAATAVAAPGDLAFRFSSVGPDTYADGSEVLPGECYALVWTRDGATFAGFAADGTAANPADSAVLMLAPVAAKGPNGMRCPPVLFQLDAELAAPYVSGGALTVCLVDTRLAGNAALAGLNADGAPKLVNAWGTVPGATVSSSGFAAAAETPQAVREGANAAEAPKNGVVGEDVILVVPAKGEKAFYGAKRN